MHLQSRPVQHRGQPQVTEDIGCADSPGHQPGPAPGHAASHHLVTVTLGCANFPIRNQFYLVTYRITYHSSVLTQIGPCYIGY